MAASQEWFTVKELADWLGCKRSTVYGWRYRRQGPPGYKPGGGSLRFRTTDVEEWLKSWRDPPDGEQQ